jgi:hypothetical protein
MDAKPTNQAVPAPALTKSTAARSRGMGQMWPFRISGERAHRSAQAVFVEELEMELELLREENARLKLERHRSPDAGAVIERVRDLSSDTGDEENVADSALEVTAESLLLREGLLDACREIARAMEEMQQRLRALSLGDVDVADPVAGDRFGAGTSAGSEARRHRISGPWEGQPRNGRAYTVGRP